ncbi:MAG: ATP-binding cassette domain-containing protein [Actinomycetota bacterium]|nr:ATP-binding cassette domain-containing protein [Actinomycetota bacterium]
MLSVRDLEVRYGSTTTVFSGLGLEIRAGEAVAVMGPSGSGKSSLLACVTGMLVPSTGQVEVGGRVISMMSSSQRAAVRREALGLVYQGADLLPELSVEENVALTILFDGQGRARALTRAREALAQVGLAEHAGKRTDEISGGQAQRVALARALIRPSMQLLVADEPTASLDAANARQMTGLLLERTRACGAGALVATHDRSVADACDRVVELRHEPAELVL